MKHKIAVVGIGHPDRGDDALGFLTLEKLKPHLPEGIATFSLLGDMVSILDIFEKFNTVILIDAILAKEGKPGDIFRFSENASFDSITIPTTSTHTFDLAQTIALANNLKVLPSQLIIYGMQGEQFQPGAPLSFAIQQNHSLFIQKILDEIKTMT